MRRRATMGVLFVGLVLSLASPASAELPDVRVESVITAIDDVHDAAMVPGGVLLATSGGLVLLRDDGTTRILTSQDGLPGTRLRSVSVLEDGTIWVGSIEGVARLRLGEDGALEVAQTLPLRRVRRAVRFDGATFFASAGQGLYRLDDEAGAEPVRVRLGAHPTWQVQTDLAVSGDELLVSTAGVGIIRVGRDGRVRGRLREWHGLADDLVWRLVPHGDRVLVATANGVSVLRGRRIERHAPESRAAAALPVRDIRAVLVQGDELWLASYGGGVYRGRPGHGEPRLAVEGSAIRGLLFPRALVATGGGVLVGHSRGAHMLRSTGSEAIDGLGGLPSGDITALERAFGSVWVGTFDHGLARITDGRVVAVDRAVTRWRLDRRINALAVTARGTGDERLWIATDRGLYWYDGRRFVQVRDDAAPGTEEHVTSLYVQPSTGDLWVASSRQVSRLNNAGWRSWTGGRGLPIVNLHAVTSDRRGTIWVGGLHGLFRFDPQAGIFERHSVSTGELPVDWVTALTSWGDGIVAGTYHGGLSWFDGETFRIETEGPDSTLPSGWVNPHALCWAGGYLWIGTLERGLVFGRDGQWRTLDLDDGLPSRDVTAILPDGENALWIGTRGGLVRVVWGDPPGPR